MLRLPAKPCRFGGCPCADCCNGREPRTTATMYGDDAMSGTYVMDLHSRHIEQHSVPGLGLDFLTLAVRSPWGNGAHRNDNSEMLHEPRRAAITGPGDVSHRHEPSRRACVAIISALG